MDKKDIVKASTLLEQASKAKEPIEQLTKMFPEMSIAEAYAIQRENIEKRIQMGRSVIGKKIGLTSVAMQKMLGVDSPDYGFIMEDMIADEETPLSLNGFIQPKVEAELAFVLKEDLKGPGVTISKVLQATEGIMASFEIIDSRIKDWKIKLEDTIADNASSAMIVLGSKMVPVDSINLKYTGLVLEKNGEIVDTAAGAAVLGHPALAVAWLANEMAKYDVVLKKGEIILAGAFTKALEIKEGDVFTATFDGVGSVKAKFIK
jgi:2-keto-4-pentenoate hydratase